MAKRRRNRSVSQSWVRRDVPYPIANRRLPAPNIRLTPLTLIEDRRLYHPDPYRPAFSLLNEVHRLVVSGARSVQRSSRSRANSFSSLPAGVGFRDPRRVLVCVRRKRRREVIHAIGKAGRGVRRAMPRRNEYSDVRC